MGIHGVFFASNATQAPRALLSLIRAAGVVDMPLCTLSPQKATWQNLPVGLIFKVM